MSSEEKTAGSGYHMLTEEKLIHAGKAFREIMKPLMENETEDAAAVLEKLKAVYRDTVEAVSEEMKEIHVMHFPPRHNTPVDHEPVIREVGKERGENAGSEAGAGPEATGTETEAEAAAAGTVPESGTGEKVDPEEGPAAEANPEAEAGTDAASDPAPKTEEPGEIKLGPARDSTPAAASESKGAPEEIRDTPYGGTEEDAAAAGQLAALKETGEIIGKTMVAFAGLAAGLLVEVMAAQVFRKKKR